MCRLCRVVGAGPRRAATEADRAAGRTGGATAAATVAYWLGLKAAIHPLPLAPDQVAEKIDRLPTAGVDPDLVGAGRRAAEKMRAAAAALKDVSAVAILFRLPSGFAEAEGRSRDAVEQCRAAERLRADLTARYGVEFPPLDVPTP